MAISNALSLHKAHMIATTGLQRVSSFLQDQQIFSNWTNEEIKGLDKLRVLVLECLTLAVEVLDYLKYSQLTMNRCLYGATAQSNWISEFLAKRIVFKIGFLLYNNVWDLPAGTDFKGGSKASNAKGKAEMAHYLSGRTISLKSLKELSNAMGSLEKMESKDADSHINLTPKPGLLRTRRILEYKRRLINLRFPQEKLQTQVAMSIRMARQNSK